MYRCLSCFYFLCCVVFDLYHNPLINNRFEPSRFIDYIQWITPAKLYFGSTDLEGKEIIADKKSV